MKSSIRQDKVTGQWVVFSQARGKRPHDLKKESGSARQVPSHRDDCPFCPGNEDELGRVLLQMPGDNPHAWSTRVIPNKYPALVPEPDGGRREKGIYLEAPGLGRHEVYIESPFHDRDLARMDRRELSQVLATYQQRYLDYGRQDDSQMVIIFRNHGPRAGTSLIHPHSQALVTSVVPRRIRLREDAARRHWDQWGQCVYCEILDYEQAHPERVVEAGSHFVALVPFAARVPFELWLLPKRHAADFAQATPEELEALTGLLSRMLRRYHERLGDPDYNYVINTAARHSSGAPHLHWYLQIRPRLTTRAGFEIGSGMHINPSLPEDDAAFLRA